MDNYILAYYQEIKDGTTIVSKWVRAIYEIIVTGLETKRYSYDAKKANKAITNSIAIAMPVITFCIAAFLCFAIPYPFWKLYPIMTA